MAGFPWDFFHLYKWSFGLLLKIGKGNLYVVGKKSTPLKVDNMDKKYSPFPFAVSQSVKQSNITRAQQKPKRCCFLLDIVCTFQYMHSIVCVSTPYISITRAESKIPMFSIIFEYSHV